MSFRWARPEVAGVVRIVEIQPKIGLCRAVIQKKIGIAVNDTLSEDLLVETRRPRKTMEQTGRIINPCIVIRADRNCRRIPEKNNDIAVRLVADFAVCGVKSANIRPNCLFFIEIRDAVTQSKFGRVTDLHDCRKSIAATCDIGVCQSETNV